jgi:hypothetical protein
MNELKDWARLARMTCHLWCHVIGYRHTGIRISDHDAGYWSACEPRFPWLRGKVSWKPELRARWRDVPVNAKDSQGVLYIKRMLDADSVAMAEALLKLAEAAVSSDG